MLTRPDDIVCTCLYFYIAIFKYLTFFQDALCSCSIKFKDKDSNKIDIRIHYPLCYVFDIIYIIIEDKSDSSSTNIFLKCNRGEFTISMSTTFNQDNNFVVYVYGLKTNRTSIGLYNRVVCHGNKEIKCTYV